MKLGAWLRTIAIRRSIDLIRTRKEAVSIDEIESERPNVEGNDLREQVLEAIGKLGKAQRETVTLYYINGYSVDEVATMQESPAGTVKRRLHEARKKLKEEMMKTVEGVLKSEAPKEDFGERVFKILTSDTSATRQSWAKLKRELGQIGTKGTEGFLRAYESPHSHVRYRTVSMLQNWAFPREGELIVEMLKRGLTDSNKMVRRNAIQALLERVEVGHERKLQEFVPLVVPLLADPSKRVRKAAAYQLWLVASSASKRTKKDDLE